MFHAVCKTGRLHGPGHVVPCNLWTDDPDELVAHMADVHHRRPITPFPLIERTRKGWKPPRRKALTIEPFAVGDWVTWHDANGQHTGQVWALHRSNRLRWVADGVTYHDVPVSQLVSVSSSQERAA